MSQSDITFLLSIIGMVGVYTASVVGGVVWLNGKFRSLEKTIYKELEKHAGRNDRLFGQLSTRILRLEIKAFGFTHAPSLQQTSEDESPDQS